jgi:hypothetical protein
MHEASDRELLEHLYDRFNVRDMEAVLTAATLSPRLAFIFICRLTGWEVGHADLPNEDYHQLFPSNIWHFAGERYKELATTTAHFVFAKGQGLPGRIWKSGEPEWISILAADLNFSRAPFFAAWV